MENNHRIIAENVITNKSSTYTVMLVAPLYGSNSCYSDRMTTGNLFGVRTIDSY